MEQLKLDSLSSHGLARLTLNKGQYNMTRPYDPNTFAHELPIAHRQFVQSVQQVLTGNIDMGTPVNKDATGQYNQFDKGNGSGILLRIGAHGSTGNNLTWPASGNLVINHGLQRQPIGCHLVSSDAQLTICQPVAPDSNVITLLPSTNTANATVYIF